MTFIKEFADILISAKRYDIVTEASVTSVEQSNDGLINIYTNKTLNGCRILLKSKQAKYSNKTRALKQFANEEILAELEEDFRVLNSNFSKISKEIFEIICSWGLESEENIKKHLHLDFIQYDSTKSMFEFEYNSENKHGDKNLIFDGHSIHFSVMINNKKFADIVDYPTIK